ncbi:MAG: orotidine-5'-phosphate decarboxylase [Bacteroidetes bacterium]|nr:MAG: orotidine-5'-phosphate decarboxylase [Bacteroidota bacterium]
MDRTCSLTNREELYSAILSKKSYLCVGLDPDPEKIPSCFGQGIEAMYNFCISIIECTKHVAVAYKPNLAFFESYGPEGVATLKRIIKTIPSDCLVIADAKRGDIGNTARMYASSLFDDLGADAATVAPYMGEDSVRPFTDRNDKWTILLALTSNYGADDFEFHGTPPLFERVIEKASAWGTLDNLMFVVGATRPELLSRVRELAPESFLLVPGVGTQGGTLEAVAKAGLNSKCGLLVNSSRGILYAADNPRSREESTLASRYQAEELASKMADSLQR